MPGTKEIRLKIRSVQNTRKITKAMEMVAASKMRKAQDRMRHARPYGEKIRNVAAHISMDYLAEIHFPATLRIGTAITRIGRTSYDIGCGIFVDGRCAATGHAVNVRVGRDRRPIPLNDPEIARLRAFMIREGGR